MEHRHLLPDEFDLLVDGEEGFGVAPLVAHVERCAACRAELASQQAVVASLERLPHHNPAPLFAYRVMSKVQVFEPWHVAAANTVQRFIPRSRPARVLSGALAGGVAVALTLGVVWVSSRVNAVAFLAGAALERGRAAGYELAASFARALVGDAGATALQSFGSLGAILGVSALLGAVLLAALGIRQLATANRRRA